MNIKHLFYGGLFGLLLASGVDISSKLQILDRYDQIFVNETPYEVDLTISYNWNFNCNTKESLTISSQDQKILKKFPGCGMVKKVEALIKKPRLDGSGEVDMIAVTPWKYKKLFYKWDKTGKWRVKEVRIPDRAVVYEVVNDYFKGGY